MSEAENKQSLSSSPELILFEGIIIGIYGNWLITLIQLISFTTAYILFQIVLTIISLVSLIFLLAIGIFGGRLETRLETTFLAFGHFLPICITFAIEGLLIQDTFFLTIGGILFFMIFYAEYQRAKAKEKVKTTNH
jgi:hypothetical protein